MKSTGDGSAPLLSLDEDLRGRVVGLAIPPPFGHASPECLDSSHRVIINMRVLLIAPHCAPFGSEPSMGYNLTKAIADHAEVSVIGAHTDPVFVLSKITYHSKYLIGQT